MTDKVKVLFKTAKISKTEQETIFLVTKGLSNQQIAKKRFVTVNTVKFHLTNVYKKLNIKSRSQLIVYMLNLNSDIVDKPKTMAELYGDL